MTLDRSELALLVKIANEDPNAFIRHCYESLSDEELDAVGYLLRIARRAQGYDAISDPFLGD